MSRVVFWSPNESMNGTTHCIIAVSALMGIMYDKSILLINGNNNSNKLESSFTQYNKLINDQYYINSNTGKHNLYYLINNNLTSDLLRNYTSTIIKGKFDILYGTNLKDKDEYSYILNNMTYITRKSDEIYDYIFLDCPKGKTNQNVIDVLNDAEVIVSVINQDEVKLEEFFDSLNEMEELKNKTNIIVIGNYDKNSKYNINNIKIRNRVKDNIYMVPHNYIFSDSCNDGQALNFFYSNLNSSKDDYNGAFISQILQIIQKIISVDSNK